ncbi:MAG: redoxin [Proteobacteria bacterium]|nr:MAG: redoxin [Pseudomonadota bacterium]
MKIMTYLLLALGLTLSACDRGRAPVFDDALLGKTAPDFSLPQLGKTTPLKLSDYQGKFVLLNFWASWCPPCRVEVPDFVDIQSKYAGDKFTIVGVSIEGRDEVAPFAKAQEINYPLTYGQEAGNKIAARYGNPDGALPYSVLISPKQEVLAIYTGAISKKKFEMIAAMYLK